MSKLGRFFHRRWPRRLAILFLVLVVGLLITRFVIRYRGQSKLDDQIAALDASDPRWRWEDIEADLPKIPDAENSALLVPQVIAARGGNPGFTVKWEKNPNPNIDAAPNHFLSPEEAAAVDEVLKDQDAALAIALSFQKYPRGRHALTLLPDSPTAETPHLKPVRTVASLLEFDMERLAVAERTDDALARVPALLSLARSLDAEPALPSQIVRCVITGRTVHSIERALAMGAPKNDLAALQRQFLAEGEVDRYTAGIRGERAAMHRLCQRFATGETSVANWSETLNPAGNTSNRDTSSPNIFGHMLNWATVGTFLPVNHAKWLEITTKAAAVSNLPEDERFGSLPNMRAPFYPEIVLVRLHFPAMQKLLATELRVRAHLRCAAVALALERYRIQNGRWPASLAEVPKNLLHEVPSDPFTDKPLKLKVRGDGITVYSVGINKKEDVARPELDKGSFKDDVAFRLYNPDQRRLPPLQKKE